MSESEKKLKSTVNSYNGQGPVVNANNARDININASYKKCVFVFMRSSNSSEKKNVSHLKELLRIFVDTNASFYLSVECTSSIIANLFCLYGHARVGSVVIYWSSNKNVVVHEPVETIS